MPIPRLTIPPSEEERKRKAREKKARWRARQKDKAAATALADHVAGIDGGGDRPPRPDIPVGDLAELIRARFHVIINQMDDDQLLSKDFAPALTLALKSQQVIDAREKVKVKDRQSEAAFALLDMLKTGGEPKRLDDGLTIDGTAVELEVDGEL